jgi:general stress protein YciG
LAVPSTRKQKYWKTKEEMVGPDLGAGTYQQDRKHLADDDIRGAVSSGGSFNNEEASCTENSLNN